MPNFKPTTSAAIQNAFLTGDRTSAPRDRWIEKYATLVKCLKVLPCHGNLWISNPDNNPLPYWGIRLDSVISLEEQHECLRLWKQIEELRPNWGKKLDLSRHDSESARPVAHIGRWDRQGNGPQFSHDLRQPGHKSGDEIRLRILRFNAWVDYIINERIRRTLYQREDMLKTLERSSIAVNNLRVESEREIDQSLVDQIIAEGRGHPLNFGHLGSMVAVTTGQSDKHHVDLSDVLWTLVMTVSPKGWGDTETKSTGNIELPQLGYSVPFRPGQAFLFPAGHQLHTVSPLPSCELDNRLVITVFMDRNMVKAAEKIPVPKLSNIKRHEKDQMSENARKGVKSRAI